MVATRLVTVLTFTEGVLHRTKHFTPDYRYTANFVDAWSIDEIVLLDIDPHARGDRAAFDAVVTRFAQKCFVPLTVGGGIRALDRVHSLMRLGADKVTLNTAAIDDISLVSTIAAEYGAQCVVASIDARRSEAGGWEVMADRGQRATGMDPAAWARRLVEAGAGEILLTSIERDGSLEGYELDLCRLVSAAVPVPVLIAGGAGSWQHFVDGVRIGGADAVCTANIYHFTETSIRSAKAFMRRSGLRVRD